MPCWAKVLLSSVDSITPGNFLALNTWNGRVKTEARTGAAVVFNAAPGATPEELIDAGVSGEVGFEMLFGAVVDTPTLTKLNLRLCSRLVVRVQHSSHRWIHNVPTGKYRPCGC